MPSPALEIYWAEFLITEAYLTEALHPAKTPKTLPKDGVMGRLVNISAFSLALRIMSILVPAEGLPGRRFAQGLHYHQERFR